MTSAAVVRVFDRTGNRDNRDLACLKFVVRKLGIDALRGQVGKEREGLRAVLAGKIPAVVSSESSRSVAPHGGGPAGPNGDREL